MPYTWRSAWREAERGPLRYVVVTGGVCSSLGKGLTASSLGLLLSRRGLRVAMAKADPYLNVDAGTMAPGEHGEVFVTRDGGETDLDLGNYERFLDQPMPARANITTGQIYQAVISQERRGEYLGHTVKVVPSITDEIVSRIRSVGEAAEADVLVLEVGGTVGDIESLPFLEAVRQLHHEVGHHLQVVHVTLVPEVGPNRELKTKPTQHSVAALRSIGLSPDALVCRSTLPLPPAVKQKLASTCDVAFEAVVSASDAESIYAVPRLLFAEGLDTHLVRSLDLPFHDVDWEDWESVERAAVSSRTLRVALCGKYVDSPDAYLSVAEALRAGAYALGARLDLVWVDAEDLDSPTAARAALEGVQGLVVPGGFGERGTEGMLHMLTAAREDGVPTLGICLGMQLMVVEAARTLAGLDANSTEMDPTTPHPVVDTMADQVEALAGRADLGGTMRLGVYEAVFSPDSRMQEAYGSSSAWDRHRHRYEVANAYRQGLEEAGLHLSATSPDATLVEGVEVSSHPFYVGVQAHPEFESRPTRPHPLFAALLRAAEQRG